MTINTAAITTAEGAIRAQTEAHWKRAWADQKEPLDSIRAKWERLEVADLDAKAALVMDPANGVIAPLEVGRGGELAVETADSRTFKDDRLIDTVRDSPDMLSARASLDRFGLTFDAGVSAMAVDIADTIEAQNSLERMLAGQLAALHMLAMKTRRLRPTLRQRRPISTASSRCSNARSLTKKPLAAAMQQHAQRRCFSVGS